MYQGKMAFAVKVDGKILRERGEQVFLPFGSEFSLLIKNLNNKRACVYIQIDGKDVVDGGLVVGANQTVDLERFISAGQLDRGHRFKFIERTAKVEANRGGIQLEDGLIRIEFEFEREYPKYEPTNWNNIKLGGQLYGSATLTSEFTISANAMDRPRSATRTLSKSPGEFTNEVKTSSGIVGGMANTATYNPTYDSASFSASASSFADSEPVSMDWMEQEQERRIEVPDVHNDAGITVEGSISEQRFRQVSFEGDGKKSVLVMKLLGEIGTKAVEKPITVRTKTKCHTCGTENKALAKFCTECGTNLEIV